MSCQSCKKKKVIKELPPVIEEPLLPTSEEIMFAYTEMSSAKGLNPQYYDEVNKTYKAIFNEDVERNCGQCGRRQFRKMEHYVKNVLQLNV